MNCEEFNFNLHEYVDGTLDVDLQSSARKHLDRCPACQRTLLREQMAAESIGRSLNLAAARLSLTPQARRNILAALESRRTGLPELINAWQAFISTHFRPIAAATAVLALLLGIAGVQIFRRNTQISDHPVGAAPRTYVVHVPIQTHTHLFQRENHSVVDAIAHNLALGDVHFSANHEQKPDAL